MSSIPQDGLPDNLGVWSYIAHFTEYAILSGLMLGALYKKWENIRKYAVVTIGISSLYGASDEFHQLFVAGRYCDVNDWITDTAGAILGAVIAILVIGFLIKRKRLR
jgi:VanZ family protein